MSRRHGGLVKNFKGFKDDWSSIKSPSSTASTPASITNLRYTDAGGIWTINSTVEFPKSQATASISVVGQTSYTSNSNQTSTNAMSTPAGSASGDMLILVVQSGTVAPNTPAGWTLSYSSDGTNQDIYIFTLNLVSSPASTYTVSFPSSTTFNISFFTVRKSSGSVGFGSGISTIDSSLTSVAFPKLGVATPSVVFAVSAVRGTTTTGVSISSLASPYAVISDITNTTSTVASRMLKTEYAAVDSGNITPSTKSLSTTVSAVTATLFSVS